MAACWIALGGNVGEVSDTFRRALALLDQTPDLSVARVSRSYTTAPVGTAAGGQFLNAAAELQTSRPPLELLGILQEVETQLGRTRTRHWGPRTLDLDLLLCDQQCLATPTLTLPHPHLWHRRFVLDPLVEIAPDVIHPRHQLTIAELRDRLLRRPLPCSLLDGNVEQRNELQQRLADAFPLTEWHDGSSSEAWLAFSLEPTARVAGLNEANRIDLQSFPTPAEQAIRDVLTAALDAVRLVST